MSDVLRMERINILMSMNSPRLQIGWNKFKTRLRWVDAPKKDL